MFHLLWRLNANKKFMNLAVRLSLCLSYFWQQTPHRVTGSMSCEQRRPGADNCLTAASAVHISEWQKWITYLISLADSLDKFRQSSDNFIMSSEGEKAPEVKPEVDIYRDTPVRFLGYANEVGEAFRALVSVSWVSLLIRLQWAFINKTWAHHGQAQSVVFKVWE